MERLVVLPVALQTNNTRTSWDAVWMAPEEIAKEGIMISPHLLDDHYTVTLEVTDLPQIMSFGCLCRTSFFAVSETT